MAWALSNFSVFLWVAGFMMHGKNHFVIFKRRNSLIINILCNITMFWALFNPHILAYPKQKMPSIISFWPIVIASIAKTLSKKDLYND